MTRDTATNKQPSAVYKSACHQQQNFCLCPFFRRLWKFVDFISSFVWHSLNLDLNGKTFTCIQVILRSHFLSTENCFGIIFIIFFLMTTLQQFKLELAMGVWSRQVVFRRIW